MNKTGSPQKFHMNRWAWGWEPELDQFTKTFFWNFQNSRADLCYILPGLGDVQGCWCQHLAPEFSGARCSVSGDMKGGQVGYS